MSRVFVHGCGVVSPAGWGLVPLRAALAGLWQPQPVEFRRPDGVPLRALRVGLQDVRPSWAAHPRLRRAGPVSHFAVAAALEALGSTGKVVEAPGLHLLHCAMNGGVQHSRRFFSEVLADPVTASPLLFPETVFNAPASHLGAILATEARSSTYVADQSGFVAALGVAADWLVRGVADSCLVVASEEADWITANALRHFSRRKIASEGAAAVWLRREPGPVELISVTSPYPFVGGWRRENAWRAVRSELETRLGSGSFTNGAGSGPDALEPLLGDGFAASGGWTCVAAIDAVLEGRVTACSALVVGANLQAIGAAFSKPAL